MKKHFMLDANNRTLFSVIQADWAESGSFLRGDYKITQRWAKVFLKALVERNSVMVEAFYMISIPQKYDQKHII